MKDIKPITWKEAWRITKVEKKPINPLLTLKWYQLN